MPTLTELDHGGGLIKLKCHDCHRVVRMRPGYLTLQHYPGSTPDQLPFKCRCGSKRIEVSIVAPRPEDEERHGLDLLTWSEVVGVFARTLEIAKTAKVDHEPRALAGMLIGSLRAAGLQIVATRRELAHHPRKD